MLRDVFRRDNAPAIFAYIGNLLALLGMLGGIVALMAAIEMVRQ